MAPLFSLLLSVFFAVQVDTEFFTFKSFDIGDTLIFLEKTLKLALDNTKLLHNVCFEFLFAGKVGLLKFFFHNVSKELHVNNLFQIKAFHSVDGLISSYWCSDRASGVFITLKGHNKDRAILSSDIKER